MKFSCRFFVIDSFPSTEKKIGTYKNIFLSPHYILLLIYHLQLWEKIMRNFWIFFWLPYVVKEWKVDHGDITYYHDYAPFSKHRAFINDYQSWSIFFRTPDSTTKYLILVICIASEFFDDFCYVDEKNFPNHYMYQVLPSRGQNPVYIIYLKWDIIKLNECAYPAALVLFMISSMLRKL